MKFKVFFNNGDFKINFERKGRYSNMFPHVKIYLFKLSYSGIHGVLFIISMKYIIYVVISLRSLRFSCKTKFLDVHLTYEPNLNNYDCIVFGFYRYF
jgi:hypothetical protein